MVAVQKLNAGLTSLSNIYGIVTTGVEDACRMRINHLSKDEDFGIRRDALSDVSSEIQQNYFEIQENRENPPTVKVIINNIKKDKFQYAQTNQNSTL